jgi:hypothetical protein
LPTGRAVVSMLAVVPSKMADPRMTLPLLNETVPYGSMPVVVVTVAVRVTVCRSVDGLGEAERADLVEAGATTSSSTDEALGADSASP